MLLWNVCHYIPGWIVRYHRWQPTSGIIWPTVVCNEWNAIKLHASSLRLTARRRIKYTQLYLKLKIVQSEENHTTGYDSGIKHSSSTYHLPLLILLPFYLILLPLLIYPLRLLLRLSFFSLLLPVLYLLCPVLHFIISFFYLFFSSFLYFFRSSPSYSSSILPEAAFFICPSFLAHPFFTFRKVYTGEVGCCSYLD